MKEADLIVTDPPYNVNYEGGNGKKIENDNQSEENFIEFLTAAFEKMREHLKNGGAFYIWYASMKQYSFEQAARNAGLTARQNIIWNKNTMTLGRSDYQWKHEPCMYGWKEGAAHYFTDSRVETTVIDDKPNINKMDKAELKNYIKELLKREPASTVIEEDKPLSNAEHPTMKPLKIIGYLIKNSSQRGETVLDPFGGSGSTLIACEQLKRKCRMMELDERYCSVIINRWERLTGKKAELIEG